MLRPFFPELVMSTDLLSFEHPSVLLFCLSEKLPLMCPRLWPMENICIGRYVLKRLLNVQQILEKVMSMQHSSDEFSEKQRRVELKSVGNFVAKTVLVESANQFSWEELRRTQYSLQYFSKTLWKILKWVSFQIGQCVSVLFNIFNSIWVPRSVNHMIVILIIIRCDACL